MATLIIKNPDGSEQEQELAESLSVGRSEGNDLILSEGGVSRRHARFFVEGSAVMVEDVARTVHISRQLGEAPPIDAAAVSALFDRYQNVYGQTGPQENPR